MQAKLLQERPQALLKACRVAGSGVAGPQGPASGSHAAEAWGSSGAALDGESWGSSGAALDGESWGRGCGEAVGCKSLSPSCLRVDNSFPAQGQLVPFSYPHQQRTVNLELEEQEDEGELQLQIGNSPSSGQWDSWE